MVIEDLIVTLNKGERKALNEALEKDILADGDNPTLGAIRAINARVNGLEEQGDEISKELNSLSNKITILVTTITGNAQYGQMGFTKRIEAIEKNLEEISSETAKLARENSDRMLNVKADMMKLDSRIENKLSGINARMAAWAFVGGAFAWGIGLFLKK